MTETTLIERRSAIAAELAELEQSRGSAVLDGQAFDTARLAECREELAALDAAECEVIRRERTALAETRDQATAEARDGLRAALESYLCSIERAETAANA